MLLCNPWSSTAKYYYFLLSECQLYKVITWPLKQEKNADVFYKKLIVTKWSKKILKEFLEHSSSRIEDIHINIKFKNVKFIK